MHLARVEDDVGEDRRHLAIARQARFERRRQGLHHRPEVDPGHAKSTTESAAQVVVEARRLRRVQTAFRGDVDLPEGRLARREECRVRLQADFVGDDRYPGAPRDQPRHRLGEHDPIEDDHRPRPPSVDQLLEFEEQADGRADIPKHKIPNSLAVFEVVPAKHPAHRREDERSELDPIQLACDQTGQRSRFEVPGALEGLRPELEPDGRHACEQPIAELHTGGARRRRRQVQSLRPKRALLHPGPTGDREHGRAGRSQ